MSPVPKKPVLEPISCSWLLAGLKGSQPVAACAADLLPLKNPLLDFSWLVSREFASLWRPVAACAAELLPLNKSLLLPSWLLFIDFKDFICFDMISYDFVDFHGFQGSGVWGRVALLAPSWLSWISCYLQATASAADPSKT